MEIPEQLKTLYLHWEKHTVKPSQKSNTQIDQEVFEQILNFSNERMSIWQKKILNLDKPYTLDPVLSTYRFCNIYRELDKQTIAFHTLLKPLTSNFSLWLLNMLFCRFICNPQTIDKIGLLNFDNKNNKEVYERLLNLPSPKYGTAYIFPISTIQKTKWNTREKFFCEYLPSIAFEVSEIIRNFDNVSVMDALDKILPVFKFNFRFHWTEILIDVAYQYPHDMNLFGKFPIGPGSIPTMKKLNYKVNPEEVCLTLTSSAPINFNYLTFNNKQVFLSSEN